MKPAGAGGPMLGRAPWVTAGPLDVAQQTLVERIRADWGGDALGVGPIDAEGRLTGPFDLMAASPGIGLAILQVASAFRDGELTDLERETVILVVAACEEADFMWEGHLSAAVAAGLPVGDAAALRAGDVPTLDEPLRTVEQVARLLLREGDLSDLDFDGAVERLGWTRLQEVVWLVGVYRALALAMRVARTPLPHRTTRRA